MWERAEGVPPTRCQPAKGRATRRGLTRVRIGASAGALLRRAGQPRTRGRAWTWCTAGGPARITAVLTRPPAGSRPSPPPRRVTRSRAPGAATELSKRAKARTKPFGRGLRVRELGAGRRAVLRVRKGKVRWVAVTSAKTRKAVRRADEVRRAALSDPRSPRVGELRASSRRRRCGRIQRQGEGRRGAGRAARPAREGEGRRAARAGHRRGGLGRRPRRRLVARRRRTSAGWTARSTSGTR